MKSRFCLFIGTILCLTALLGGCGQPGPLYLPKPPAAKAATSGDAARPGAMPAAVPSTTPVSQP